MSLLNVIIYYSLTLRRNLIYSKLIHVLAFGLAATIFVWRSDLPTNASHVRPRLLVLGTNSRITDTTIQLVGRYIWLLNSVQFLINIALSIYINKNTCVYPLCIHKHSTDCDETCSAQVTANDPDPKRIFLFIYFVLYEFLNHLSLGTHLS